MATTSSASAPRDGVRSAGRLIQHWRRARQKSQIVLALDAGISARHLGFLEIGRAKPSREMVLILADALDVPLRERNGLLMAAGYAPLYRETGLDVQEMAHARRALELILSQQEPYPAVVMDRHWNIVMTNEAASRFFARLVVLDADQRSANVIRLMFDPTGLRPFVANWPAVAKALIHRVHREALGGVPDEETARLLAEVLSYPGVPKPWQSPDVLGEPPTPYLAVEFRKGNLAMNFFSTVTTLGTPQDITLQEMRIESFFPADKETEVTARRLLGD